MKVEFPRTVLELDPTEAAELFYALRRDLEKSIDSHWVDYPGSYKSSESRRLYLLDGLHRSVGHGGNPRAELQARLDELVAKKPKSP